MRQTGPWSAARIVFDRARDLFSLYGDRKLLTPETIGMSNGVRRRGVSRAADRCREALCRPSARWRERVVEAAQLST
jgi:hypothetical protein